MTLVSSKMASSSCKTKLSKFKLLSLLTPLYKTGPFHTSSTLTFPPITKTLQYIIKITRYSLKFNYYSKMSKLLSCYPDTATPPTLVQLEEARTVQITSKSQDCNFKLPAVGEKRNISHSNESPIFTYIANFKFVQINLD